MTIGRICAREVHLADPDEPVADAARRMHDHNVGSLVVVNADKVPVGILTDRDLAIRVLAAGRQPDETTVADVMTQKPRTAPEDLPIEEALRLMRALAVRRLVVVDGEDRLLGIVSVADVLRLLAEEFRALDGLLGKGEPV